MFELRKIARSAASHAATPTERRFVVAGLEARAGDDDGERVLTGYAAKFDRETRLYYFTEVIRKGAFATSLEEGDDVRALLNHDANHVLGRTKSGTLALEEDDTGLRVEITLPDTQTARDLYTSIERGDIDQMSFAFVVEQERWTEEQKDDVRTVLRELLSVRLYDVSPVTYPAYEDTEIGVRQLEQLVEGRSLDADSRAVFDRVLAEAGLADPTPDTEAEPATRSLDLHRKRLDLLART